MTYIASTLILSFLFLTVVFFGCGPSQEEYQKQKIQNEKLTTELNNLKSELDGLKKNLEQCTSTVEDLKNTPTERLAKARKLQDQGDVSGAETEYQGLIQKYPDSEESKTAKNILIEIEKKKEEERIAKEKEQIEAEKKKRLGFKALKVENPVSIEPLKIKINSINSQQQWTFDRYGYEYRYRDARRGFKYVVADVSVTSDVHNPQLPSIEVYKTYGDKLSYIGTLHYDFYRWEDYGSYLGNDADFGNDFAHTKTIRFVAGLEISEDELKDQAVFVFINNQMCFDRISDRFGRPPVEYSGTSCKYQRSISLEEAEKNYHLIKVFNPEKI